MGHPETHDRPPAPDDDRPRLERRGPRRAGGGPLSFLQPLRAAARAGLPVGGVGRQPGELEDARRCAACSCRALLFVASFSAIFIVLGLAATELGATLNDHRETLERVSAVVIIALGVFFLPTPFVARLNREWRIDALMERAGTRRAARRRGGVRDRLDPLRRAALGVDPRTAASLSDSAAQGATCSPVLARPRDPVPADRDRLQPHDHRVRVVTRHYAAINRHRPA